MHCAIKPDPHHLRDTAGIITVRLVDLRLQHRPHVPRLNTDHRQVGFTKRAEQPLRQRPRFQSDPLKAICRTSQYLQQSVGLARNLNLPNDFTRPIHNADARVLDRYVQSSKKVHAALLLMLGARTTVNPVHHQPEAHAPTTLSAIHKLPADYPIFWHKADMSDSELLLCNFTPNPVSPSAKPCCNRIQLEAPG